MNYSSIVENIYLLIVEMLYIQFNFLLNTAVAVTPFTSISTIMRSPERVLLTAVVTPCLD